MKRDKLIRLAGEHHREPPPNIDEWLKKKNKDVALVHFWNPERKDVLHIAHYPENDYPPGYVRVNYNSALGWYKLIPNITVDNFGNIK